VCVPFKKEEILPHQIACGNSRLCVAKLQIEYLHDKFAETGSGNQALAQIQAALSTSASEASK